MREREGKKGKERRIHIERLTHFKELARVVMHLWGLACLKFIGQGSRLEI